ncbi:squalene/phytoene synthase family protein [Pseudooceanicola aestuarii]|uniref:squalene/phytoene synthase family protein n=1 Tax=Pseudooceanicola aestuarii TaxID=2697319 RepID=UPI0013D315D4|nr:squalene/phytoene synthase family protein [Pseudooceanicola aestuarii]
MNSDFDDDLTACARLVERGDPDRFRAVMAAPVAARRGLFPLYAFNLEVARAPWVTQEPMIAQMRLQWWRDALAEIAAGGPVRRHEVVTPLALVLDGEAAHLLDALIVARHRDLEKTMFEDETALWSYLENTSGRLLDVAARILGRPLPAGLAADAGAAFGLARWFLAIPELEEAGRAPLPDGRSAAVADLAGRGLERLANARRVAPALAAAQRPALYPLAGTGAILSRVARRPGRVAAGEARPGQLRDRVALMRMALTGRF